MILLFYPSKKELKTQIGKPLRYQETSLFGNEYVPDGNFVGTNSPHLTGMRREFFAEITMSDGLIKAVK